MAEQFIIPLIFGSGRLGLIETTFADRRDLVIIMPCATTGATDQLLSEVDHVFQRRKFDIAKVAIPDHAGLLRNDAFPELLASDAADILNFAISRAEYRRVWLIGGAYGSLALGKALPQFGFPLDRISCVWLSPPLQGTSLSDELLTTPVKSLVVIDCNDPDAPGKVTRKLKAQEHITVCKVDGLKSHAVGSNDLLDSIKQAKRIVSSWGGRVVKAQSRTDYPDCHD
jgi:hypothetical protein